MVEVELTRAKTGKLVGFLRLEEGVSVTVDVANKPEQAWLQRTFAETGDLETPPGGRFGAMSPTPALRLTAQWFGLILRQILPQHGYRFREIPDDPGFVPSR